MRPDGNASEAENKGIEASDPQFVDEYEQIDEEAEQNQGQSETWQPSKHLENAVGSESLKSPLLLVLRCGF
jgi:hypothetical protein